MVLSDEEPRFFPLYYLRIVIDKVSEISNYTINKKIKSCLSNPCTSTNALVFVVQTSFVITFMRQIPIKIDGQNP